MNLGDGVRGSFYEDYLFDNLLFFEKEHDKNKLTIHDDEYTIMTK